MVDGSRLVTGFLALPLIGRNHRRVLREGPIPSSGCRSPFLECDDPEFLFGPIELIETKSKLCCSLFDALLAYRAGAKDEIQKCCWVSHEGINALWFQCLVPPVGASSGNAQNHCPCIFPVSLKVTTLSFCLARLS
jgi:hypothetical protein